MRWLNWLFLMLLVVFLSVLVRPAVWANPNLTVTDLDQNGDGYEISATANGFKVAVRDQYVKISLPFHNRPTDDGIRQGKPGEVLVARASWVDDKRIKHVIKSKPFVISQEGRVEYVFSQNPSVGGAPVYVTVDHGSINDQQLEWLAPPWTSLVHFAKNNPNHPKDSIHCFAFWLEGDKVRPAVEQARKFGWTPSAEFHSARGDM